MQQPVHRYFRHKRTLLVLVIVISLVGIATSSFKGKGNYDEKKAGKDSVASVAAFMDVYKVLMHPRCLNCHPAGNIPLQNDDSHIHSMYPKRGTDGHGLYAMKCSYCHQPANTAGLHTPPGNPSGLCHQPT